MDAKELRLGNYVNDTTCKTDHLDSSYFRQHYFEILGIWKRENDSVHQLSLISQDGRKHTTTKLNIVPIPLTEELLEKLGFHFDSCTYSKDNVSLIKSNENQYVILHAGELYKSMNAISYLHDLQNKFYAITGKDLTINL